MTRPMHVACRYQSARARISVMLCAVCLAQTGCRKISQPKGLMEESATASKLSSLQLRYLVDDYVVRYSDQVERDADHILARTTDPAIHRNALRWKINGIRSCFRAASRRDPLGAYLDLWVLNRQTQQLFSSAEGELLFGSQQALALETCRSLETQLRSMEQALGGDLNILDGVVVGADFVAAYAARHPIDDLYFDRELMGAEYLHQIKPASDELLDVVGNLEGRLDELQRLSRLYAAHLPKQARWEAELLLLDAARIDTIAQPLRQFSTATDSVVRIAATTDSLPQLIAHERQQLHHLVRTERQESLRELERMRGDTIGALVTERELVLDTLRQERGTVLETLHAERMAISSEGKTELAAALREADRISKQRTEEMAQEAIRLVDYLLTRTVQIGLAIGLVALTLAAAWYLLGTHRRQTAAGLDGSPLIYRKNRPDADTEPSASTAEDSTAAAA